MNKMNLKNTIFLWLVALAIGQGVAGCAGMESRERRDALDVSLATYSAALRWGRYEDAAAYRVPRSQPVKPLDRAQLEHIRVAAYEVLEQILNEDQTEATLTVSIQYYHDDVGALKTFRERQVWWYDKAQKRWFLDGDLPDFTAAFHRRE